MLKVIQDRQKTFLKDVLGKVPYEHKRLLCRAYGVFGSSKYTHSQLAKEYGISRSGISKRLYNICSEIKELYIVDYVNYINLTDEYEETE